MHPTSINSEENWCRGGTIYGHIIIVPPPEEKRRRGQWRRRGKFSPTKSASSRLLFSLILALGVIVSETLLGASCAQKMALPGKKKAMPLHNRGHIMVVKDPEMDVRIELMEQIVADCGEITDPQQASQLDCQTASCPEPATSRLSLLRWATCGSRSREFANTAEQHSKVDSRAKCKSTRERGGGGGGQNIV